MAAEEAGADGTIDVQCWSNDHDYMKTTVMNLPTDFVKATKPTLSRVSPVGTKEAHTDGNRIVQYKSDDQNSTKTTIMQMPMDFLEIPEPLLPRFFFELAEEARYVDVGSGQSCYTEEVQSQEAGLTRPVLVTIMECSSSVPKGGLRQLPVSLPRVYHLFLLLVGPWDKTEQSVLPGSDKKNDGTDPSGPVIPISQWLMAQWARRVYWAQWTPEGCLPSVNLNQLVSSADHPNTGYNTWVETGRWQRHFGYTTMPA